MITAFEFESPNGNILTRPPNPSEYITEYFGAYKNYNRCVRLRMPYWKFILAYYAVDGTDEEGDATLAIDMCKLKAGL